jgi:hypothetical protein
VSGGVVGWVEVANVTALEAEVLRAALETAEIPVQTLGEAVARIIGLSDVDLGIVRVMVPEDRAEEARELLADSQPVDFPEGD